MIGPYETIRGCRSCAGESLPSVLEFGTMPASDALLSERDLDRDEPHYPQTVLLCESCGLMQLAETVAPEVLFDADYPYFSSYSPALLRHSEANVDELIERRRLGTQDLIVELASNDGYLLQFYAKQGIPVLGIDPAPGPAQAAVERGIETLNTFFSEELARELRQEGRRAQVIHANNVLAHVPDLNGFVRGVATLLDEAGVAVIEVPHVRELIRHCEFDTIYHEHLCYFSVTALRPLFVTHGGDESDEVKRILAQEAAEGLDVVDGYRSFGARVAGVRDSLRELLGRLKGEGASIAAYGAAAKGATLVNYVGIGSDTLDFVVDRNTHKHGRYMPGQHIPIFPTEKLLEAQPDYALMLAWNFKDEILEQQAEYRNAGGRFIVPIPEPVIV